MRLNKWVNVVVIWQFSFSMETAVGLLFSCAQCQKAWAKQQFVK